ncbi:acyltransferase family protein [Sneathiella sp. P13V-1]|uniref:acyltransferase family protein n=1 Tax=Sneathiella sp. P13V-1 TaxID=2697366 RepID=UPI00187B681D|nr:acyltransferase family protein [Sneathiella sp. P13V-1]MBE7638686.1 acyltransferase family protein [Sneathiella sp. P13V-1]
MQEKPSQFRYDINALRAIAVLSVLLYHFDVSGFDGGFVGVDVFFVISGFLMTDIISTRISSGQFNLKDFYRARIQRILPALSIVVLALLVAGYFWLTPLDYKHMGEEARSAMLFVSNSFYSNKGGYFDPVSHEKWLLHTWSLSIEMQFYLLWPLFLLVLNKYLNKALRLTVVAVFVMSLIWSVVYTSLDSASAFFALPPRIWEFIAGGLIYLYIDKIKPIKGMTEVGLAMILAAVFFYSGSMSYPGYWAILPVLGAALFIAAKPTYFPKNHPLQYFGNISYSLYLWHWPVMLFAKYFALPFTAVNVSGLLLLSVLLAHISYHFIETPLRRKFSWKFSLGITVVAILIPVGIVLDKGIPNRVPDEVRLAENARKDINPRLSECIFDGKETLPECMIGKASTPKIAVWGDSHADSLFVAIDEALKATERTGVFHALSACPPAIGELKAAQAVEPKKFQNCQKFKDLVWNKIETDQNITDVILIGRWTRYFSKVQPAKGVSDKMVADEYKTHIVDTICSLSKLGKTVYVVAPVPEMDLHVPRSLAKSKLINGSDPIIETSKQDYLTKHKIALEAFTSAQNQCQAIILDPTPYLCEEDKCSGIKNGVPIYRDNHHLSVTGSLLLKPLFIGIFSNK